MSCSRMLGRGACATVNRVWKGGAFCIYFPVAKENKQTVCHICGVVMYGHFPACFKQFSPEVQVWEQYFINTVLVCSVCVIAVPWEQRRWAATICGIFGVLERQNPLAGTTTPNLAGGW